MKVSLNIVKQLIDVDLPPVDQLVMRINQRLGEVEQVIDLGAKYLDAKIVQVVECQKHPNADKLSITKIDDGGVVKGVERDGAGLVQVVCGAPNVRSGMWAVWLPPNSVVPETFEEAEPFYLTPKELRGVVSNGMLASEKELGLSSDHQGIVDIQAVDLAEGHTLTTGASFASVFGLDDVIIDIENKMFTHRPDLFGQLGVAREISAIIQENPPIDQDEDTRFDNPDWYRLHPQFDQADGLDIEVFNSAIDASPRFMAVAIRGVEIAPSPLWLKCQLVAMGAKLINNIVDLTNYVMLMTAQPVHAYDYDRLRGRKLGVRMAKKGEKLDLLNGKSYQLTVDDIVIADGDGAIGLAGVMGGLDSEVTSATKNIVLEVANFDMYTIRKTSMRHGLFTDAVTRYTKGQSSLQATRAMKRLLDLMPGQQASKVFDLPDRTGQLLDEYVYAPVQLTVDFVNQRLGSNFTGSQIGNILRRANFTLLPADDDEDLLTVTAPYWRTDVEQAEDVVEEVGRLYGFDRLDRELPPRLTGVISKNPARDIKQQIRDKLSSFGANEVLSYSFVHENVLKNAKQDVSQAFRLSNALSPDLQYYRLTVLPSLLDKVHMNIKAGHDEFTLFEIGKGHNKLGYNADDELPKEFSFIDAVYASKKPKQGAVFYVIRHQLNQLARSFGLQLVYRKVGQTVDSAVTAPFELSRSAVVETESGVTIGFIGELRQDVIKNFKLPHYTSAMTLDFDRLATEIAKKPQTYRPLSRYPSVSQDVSIKVPSSQDFMSVKGLIDQIITSHDIEIDVRPISIYQSESDTETKTMSFRLVFTSFETTLSDKDVTPIVQQIENLVI